MAEIAVGILAPAVEVVRWVAAPIKRQLSYLCCFTRNVAALKDEAKTLDYKTDNLQERVDTDKNNGREEIHEIVKDWLAASCDITRTKERILAEATEVGLGSGCFNYAKRVSLTKEALKTTEAMKELIDRCKFDSVSRSPPSAASSAFPLEIDIYEFSSRKRFEDDIMRNLNKDKNVDKVGVWGIGGVGKTVMAKMILNRALKEGLFDEVVMVIVSQPVDKKVIQEKIAAMLLLKTLKDEELLEVRAHILRRRLMQKKRSLILLDDVWESLDLEELGIPCDGERCTIILTSRDKEVLKRMNVKNENICELGVLDDDEAWDFFKKMARICVDDRRLYPTAYKVMKKCKGLLVALKAVGKAHEDNKDRDLWKYSLRQLRKHKPDDINDVIKKVYKPLRLSYDRLEDKNAQSLFLLCCLFAEDTDIPLERLTYFAIGLRLFDDICELEEMRGKIRTLIQMLINRCLLVNSSEEDHVRMHDVLREVSISIAFEERRANCSDCTWISSHVDRKGTSSNMKLLWMNSEDVEQQMEIDIGNLIGGSTELNVLFIEWGFLKSLPLHTPQSLKTSLTTLILSCSNSLESIAVVGQLESLEILICHNCSSIKELPEQVKRLERLKLLEISECNNLQRIAAGVISSLVGLEELKIVNCFDKWEGSGVEDGKEATTNAGLSEIKRLKKLRRLDIRVRDIALAAQPLHLSSKLVHFRVIFGEAFDGHYNSKEQSYQRRTYLDLGNESDGIHLGDLSENVFLTHSEYLYARGDNQDFNLSLTLAQRIRGLTLRDFTNKKNISSVDALSLLDFLALSGLFNLEEIWDAPIPSNSFDNLKHLTLHELWVLKRMGKIVMTTPNDLFLQFETIQIQSCFEMEHLLLLTPNEEEEQGKENHIGTILTFPKLKNLLLDSLPKLTSICSRGNESIHFPLLDEMWIEDCKNFKWLVSGDDHHHYEDVVGDDDSLHLFCHRKVSFPELKKLTLRGYREIKDVWCDLVPDAFFRGLVELRVESCDKIKRLFSSSSKIPQNLINLQILHIDGCGKMVKVIEDDDEVSSRDCTTKHTSPLFRSLQNLNLLRLPKLESFCEWRCALELPSLKTLDIKDCDKMRSFNAGAGSLIITATITVEGVKLASVDDLNAALHEKAKRKREEATNEEEEEEEEVDRAMDERVKTAADMKELIQICKFESVSRPLPIAASSAFSFGKDIYEFNSWKRFEEDIMKNLNKDKNVDKVGVWGIGGVGKTVMAQKILNRALKEGLFHEVKMVTVSQPVDKLVIQEKIAEQLGLTTLRWEETLIPRANKLSARLRLKKRSLILLDDVWEPLNLEELGIPCDGKWCTIILTSRNKDVLKGMKVKNVCELGVLDEDEAWDFFKKMAGTCVEDAKLKPIAYEVMKKCKGLLLALESVGKAHKDEKEPDIWRDSLRQLIKRNPKDIPNVIKEVYKPLKLSYDHLMSKNAKSLFLLCCLFAEDAHIPLEQLTYFAIGLRLFDDILELELMRGRIRRLIETLRNRCLLLDSSKRDHVRMHDVVRDVSIFIASKEGLVNSSDCTWISSHVDRRGASSKLKLLLMNSEDEEQEMKINIGKKLEEAQNLMCCSLRGDC